MHSHFKNSSLKAAMYLTLTYQSFQAAILPGDEQGILGQHIYITTE